MNILKKKKTRKRREELHKLIRLQGIDERYYDSLKKLYYDDKNQLEHVEILKQKNRLEWLNKINIIKREL